jgi:phosphoribosylaminoimidazole carboxylase PurE protein
MKENMAVILMGSKGDYDHAKKIEEWLDHFGISRRTRIASAHKTPERLLEIIHETEAEGNNVVYIAIAGLSNALSGMVEFATTSPVVSCPPPSESFGGADIFSSLRMPPGVAAAALLDPRNAAIFTAKIFALSDPSVKDKIQAYHMEQKQKLYGDDASMVAAR